jgi:SPOR domain
MLRKQTDGSYRLIAGSFPSLAEADRYARLLGNEGYHAVITPKRVSDDLLLHRVEIQGLKTLQEANDVWDIGLRNQWLALVGNSSTGQR